MQQDANRIIDNLSDEWMKEIAMDKRKIAFLKEENERLKQQVQELQQKDSE